MRCAFLCIAALTPITNHEVDREISDVVYIMTYPKDPHARITPEWTCWIITQKIGVKMGQIWRSEITLTTLGYPPIIKHCKWKSHISNVVLMAKPSSYIMGLSWIFHCHVYMFDCRKVNWRKEKANPWWLFHFRPSRWGPTMRVRFCFWRVPGLMTCT